MRRIFSLNALMISRCRYDCLFRAFRLGRKDLLLFCCFIIRAFRLGRKDLLLFCCFIILIIIRAFRLGRKDLLFFLCFIIIIILFLDKCWSNILSKRQSAVKKYYYIYVGNSSAIRIRLCQLPVPALPVSRRQFVFDI